MYPVAIVSVSVEVYTVSVTVGYEKYLRYLAGRAATSGLVTPPEDCTAAVQSYCPP